jgi:hypothetical protein
MRVQNPYIRPPIPGANVPPSDLSSMANLEHMIYQRVMLANAGHAIMMQTEPQTFRALQQQASQVMQNSQSAIMQQPRSNTQSQQPNELTHFLMQNQGNQSSNLPQQALDQYMQAAQNRGGTQQPSSQTARLELNLSQDSMDDANRQNFNVFFKETVNERIARFSGQSKQASPDQEKKDKE